MADTSKAIVIVAKRIDADNYDVYVSLLEEMHAQDCPDNWDRMSIIHNPLEETASLSGYRGTVTHDKLMQMEETF